MARYIYCIASVYGFGVIFSVNLTPPLAILVALVVQFTNCRNRYMDSN